MFKRSPLKCKILRHLSIRVKVRQIVVSILKQQVNSSSNFASFFIVTAHNSSVNFKLIHFLLWVKGSYQSQIFRLLSALLKFAKFLMSFFKPHVTFSSNFSSLLNVLKDNSSVFFSSKVMYFAQKEQMKVETWRILSAQVKIHQILVMFETMRIIPHDTVE